MLLKMIIYSKYSKIQNIFLCSEIQFWFSRLKFTIHKMLVRIANREAPDRTADLGLHCLSMPFWQDALQPIKLYGNQPQNPKLRNKPENFH